jgi:hypothetical protein
MKIVTAAHRKRTRAATINRATRQQLTARRGNN